MKAFQDFIRYLTYGDYGSSIENRDIQEWVISTVVLICGESSYILSEICKFSTRRTSILFAHPTYRETDNVLSGKQKQQGKIEAALNYAGLCLLVRIRSLGAIHEKTADSHYNLGVLYEVSDILNKL